MYNLDALSLIRKITETQIGAQDEGCAFSPDGILFYNIEKPIYSTRTQLDIYNTVLFKKTCVFLNFQLNLKEKMDNRKLET